MAKFYVDNRTLPVDYSTNEELYYHTFEAAVPEAWRFPDKYRGNGTGSVWFSFLYMLIN